MVCVRALRGECVVNVWARSGRDGKEGRKEGWARARARAMGPTVRNCLWERTDRAGAVTEVAAAFCL